MAIKVTTGQQTFVKKIVIGTPISTAQTGLSIDNFSDFKVSTIEYQVENAEKFRLGETDEYFYEIKNGKSKRRSK